MSLRGHDNMKDLNEDILKKAVKYHQVKFVAQDAFQLSAKVDDDHPHKVKRPSTLVLDRALSGPSILDMVLITH